MSRYQFLIRQCSNQHCRFRFPAPASQDVTPFCPKCGHRLLQVEGPYGNMPGFPATTPRRRMVLSILLDNVRSALNVGSIIRTADGIGVDHIHLCGISATPHNPKVGKTALSAETSIKWSYHLNAVDTVEKMKHDGYLIWSLEITGNSIPIHKATRPMSGMPVVLVAGNEQAGVDPAILSISDQIIHLPMYGSKSSLNIAVAVGIAAFMLITSS